MCDAGHLFEFKPGDEPTALYRLYDAEGVVIRIGITQTPARRMANYGFIESWWPEVARATMTWYPNPHAACAAETRAIQAEDPKYNVRKRSSPKSLVRASVTTEEKAKIIADYLKEKRAAFDAGEWVDIFPGGPGRSAHGKWSTPAEEGTVTEATSIHRNLRGRLRGGNAQVQEEWDLRVRAAKRYRAVVPTIVPGLLQTAGYARAILTQVADLWDTADVDATVETRMRRQEVLYDNGKTFEFVITEAALRLLPCPRPVMAGQLDRLLSMDLPNVTLGIIPMGVPLAVTPPYNTFDLLDDRVIAESPGAEDEPGEDESAVYARLFGLLMAESVTGEEARRLIAAAAEALRG